MIKVLVVEDETPILRSICYMIEKTSVCFKITDTACNGKKAIELLEKNDYDVLFLDINMPVLNGIRVMEYISENNIDIITVILSGYREFEYAKKAIEHGAFNYLIKPLDRKILAETLIDIENELLKNERQKELFNVDVRKYKDFDLASNEPCYIAMLCFGSIRMGNDLISEVEEKKKDNLESCEDFLCDNVNSSNFIFLESRDIDIAFIIFRCDLSEIKDIFTNLLAKCCDSSVPTYAYVYNKHIKMDNITCVEEKLRIVAINMIDFKEEKLHILNETELTQNIENKNFISFVNELKCIDELTGFTQFKCLCDNFLRDENISRWELTDALRRLLRKICEQEKNDYFTIEKELFFLLDNLFEHNKILDEYIAFIINNFYKDNRNTEKDLLAYKIHEYIKRNYSKQISLHSIADHFGFVSNHIRRTFKAQYNQSPNDYITQLRMEKVKLMLLSGTCAKDAAEAVGYKDTLYFYKIFKKYTGVTACEYKAKKIEKS